MRITTLGSGTVGGGLAARWRNAGHEVTELRLDGGGTLENARSLEDFLAVAAANLSDGGHTFYRFWRPSADAPRATGTRCDRRRR